MELDNQQERLVSDLSWLAGVWESEGSFSLSKQNMKHKVRYRPICGMVNTDPDMIEAVVDILKKNYISHYLHRREIPSKRIRIDVLIYGVKRVNRFLTLIIPFLKSKVIRAKLLQQYVEYRLSKDKLEPYGTYEEDLCSQLKDLNKRGNTY